MVNSGERQREELQASSLALKTELSHSDLLEVWNRGPGYNWKHHPTLSCFHSGHRTTVISENPGEFNHKTNENLNLASRRIKKSLHHENVNVVIFLISCQADKLPGYDLLFSFAGCLSIVSLFSPNNYVPPRHVYSTAVPVSIQKIRFRDHGD